MTQAIEQINNSNNWQAIKEAAITRLKESGELSGKKWGDGTLDQGDTRSGHRSGVKRAYKGKQAQ